MRKLTLIALTFVLTVSLAACGCRRYDPAETEGTSEPITVPTQDMTLPSSNVPDPTVDDNSTRETDGTGNTDGTEDTRASSETEGTAAE